MIRNRHIVDLFEDSLVSKSVADYRRNLQFYEALFREACSLGVLPPKDPLDGIDSDVQLARVMNVRRTA